MDMDKPTKTKLADCIITVEHPKTKKPIRMTLKALLGELHADATLED
jgi:hypothetical protein